MNEQFIGHVMHVKDNSFNHNKAKIASVMGHPLGTVYQKGWWVMLQMDMIGGNFQYWTWVKSKRIRNN